MEDGTYERMVTAMDIVWTVEELAQKRELQMVSGTMAMADGVVYPKILI